MATYWLRRLHLLSALALAMKGLIPYCYLTPCCSRQPFSCDFFLPTSTLTTLAVNKHANDPQKTSRPPDLLPGWAVTMETISMGTSDPSLTHQAEIDGVPVPVSVVHVTIPNQSVQSMIHGQPSVIQTASGQTIQTIQVGGANIIYLL